MKRSYLIAAGLLVAVTVWLVSGRFAGSGPEARVPEQVDAVGELTRVRVRTSTAREITREILIHGHTAPLRIAHLRAETAGRVAAVPAPRGARVEEGAPLVRLAEEDRGARLRQVEALVRQRKLEYQAAQSLKRQGLKAETQLAEALSLLRAAEAQFEAISLDIQRCVVHAPFAGVLDQRPLEVGDYVAVGDPVATVVQLDPFLVTGQVAEQEAARLAVGAKAQATLVGGETMEGRIRYIAAVADPDTRTFAVELEVPNPQGRRLAGMTAEIRVPVATVSAHRVSPAVLSLDDGGVVGVKTVDDQGVVQFRPARIARSDPEGLWLAGLPETVRLITVGQGFVRAGERVEPVDE